MSVARSARLAALRGATFVLVLTTIAPTQQRPDPGPALAKLRASNLTLAEATDAASTLQTQSTVVRLQASDLLRAAFLERLTGNVRAGERAAKQVEKAASGLQRAALGKNGALRVDELRTAARAVSRRANLSKAMIHDELDPMVEELRKLLLPGTDQVLATDPTLADALAAMRMQRTELAQWFSLYVAMVEGFDLHPDAQEHLTKVPPPNPPPLAEHVDQQFGEWVLLGLPLSNSDRRAIEDNAQWRGKLDGEEYDGTLELNRLRYLLGRSMLRIDAKLGEAARDHSRDMVDHNFFAHESPVPGKKTFGDRASRFGTSASAENIATGQSTGREAILGWWYSPGHHRNMLGEHGRVGLGRSGTMWTQVFGG